MSYASSASEPNDDRLGKLRDWFSTAEGSSSDARKEAERARDYYDGRQLTKDELAALADRGQPPVIDNRVKPKVNYLLGLEKRGRTDPKAFPRTPADEEGADAATDAIRYVCDDNLFEDIASSVCENMLIEGFGGADVIVEHAANGGHKIRIEHYPWDRLFYDPHSRKPDFTDALYLGGVVWMDEDGVIARWGREKASEAISGAYAYSGGTESQTYDDRPQQNVWADIKRKRVRVIQIHWIEGGEWWFATFTAGGFLEEASKSPYVDEDGKSECSLVVHSGYVDRRNWRYGIVRDMFDPQDEVNKRRSKALHLLSVRQVVAERGAVEDVDEARRELAKPDGYIEVAGPLRFEIQENGDLTAGQFQLLQEAKMSLEAVGPNAFLAGKQSQAASGRAIMASQQGGQIEIDGAIMDRYHQWKRRVYRAIWNRVRQFWTAEKWVRVTDDERNIRFVGLNRPVTLGDRLGELPPDQQAAAAQQLGLRPGDPRLQQPIAGPDGQPVIANNVARMMVDIVVDEAPDVASLQIEQFGMLVDIAGKMPGAIPPELIIEASTLRNKDKILEKMGPPKGPDGQPLPPPPPPEVVKMQAELEMKKQQQAADLEIAHAKLQLDAQTAQQNAALAQQQAEAQAANDNAKLQAQIELDRQKLAGELQLQEAKLAGEMRLAEMELAAKLDLARQEAAAKLDLARQTSRENADIRREEMANQPQVEAAD